MGLRESCCLLPELSPQVEDEDVLSKGRLGPGNMITLDLETGDFKENVAVKQDLASKAPYAGPAASSGSTNSFGAKGRPSWLPFDDRTGQQVA